MAIFGTTFGPLFLSNVPLWYLFFFANFMFFIHFILELLGVEIALCVSCTALWLKIVSFLFSAGLPKVQGFRPS